MFLSPGDQTGQFRAIRRVPTVMPRSHWHMHLEIVFCAGTPITYEMTSDMIAVDTGQVAVFWAAFPHRVAESDIHGEVYVVNIPLESAFQWNFPVQQISDYLEGQAKVAFPPENYGKSTFHRWFKDINSGEDELLQIVQLELLSFIRRLDFEASDNTESYGYKRSASRQFGELMRRVIEQMQQDDGANVSVQSISDALGMNPKYLTTKFKSNTGVTLGSYIRRSKVAAARALLLDTDLSATQIAHEAGFGSLSQFYSVMKAETSLTPSQIRSRS
ncbi:MULTISPECIES: helix-turn-helix domain-containing protein [Primorskyibacter]|uniref:Transcriptional regulator, AraC family n=1 Tax=Primorskyibacter flagellatus TaxID=1387277 RepID=A0A1W2EKZ4_9RHOB|nr:MULTISPECIES: helix-turn-helix domain-containing protein [Primorskyibacter]SMD10380.1 transcriptional regulator, AraC family [Primorskyibacter flagellatus]